MKYLSFLFAVLFIFSMQTIARPKIGLVLSGGGAKGGAHIGVLKILEENRVPVDYIVGTSIGSYVGGLYALGYSADEIETLMLNTAWEKGYSDFVPRQDLLYADKELRDDYNLTFRLGYSDGKLKMPSGLLLGQSALQLLKLSTDAVGEFNSFDELPIPYRAVATDIATSKAVVLDAGSLSQAMKASSTVPGALEPININGQLLVDGGIVNNMPVDVARQIGADIIIAIDIGSPLLDKKSINRTVDVLDQLSTILTITTTNNQKRLLTEKDLLIRPDIDNLSTTDFSIVGKALIEGEKAATAELKALKKLAVDESVYAEIVSEKQRKKAQWLATLSDPIIAIKYENDSKVDIAIIQRHLSLSIGDVVNKTDLANAIERIYALDRFDYVNAEFIDSELGRTLVVTTKAKSWGPDYLHFGFSWQGDFSSRSILQFDFAYILTDFSSNGGLWKNEASVGWETTLATEFYQPFDQKQDFFGRARLSYQEDKVDKSSYQLRPELSNKYTALRLGSGFNYADNGILELGFISEIGNIKFENVNYENIDYDSLGAYFIAGFDDLNSINFPTKGNKLLLELYYLQDDYDHSFFKSTEDNVLQILLDWRGAFTVGNHSFVGIGSAATVVTDNDFSIRASELGGFLNLSGYQKDALVGAHKVFAAAAYQYDLGHDIPGTTGLPLYMGVSLETGNVWALQKSVDFEELVTSGSLYLGTDTSFGPAVIGMGYATSFSHHIDDQLTLFFSLGKNW